MIIKKIEADTMSAALTRAKELFGTDAKIHSTATLTNGKFQIIASAQRLRPSPIRKPIMVMDETDTESDGNYLEEFVSDRDSINSLKLDVVDIKETVQNQMESFSKTLHQASWGMEMRMHPTVPFAISMLLENGIGYSDAKELAINLPRTTTATSKVLTERLLNKVNINTDLQPGIHCYLGATGSGKTAVLVKSALMLKTQGFTVCMVVGNANSPGAHDELDRIGSIIGIDVFAESSDIPRDYYNYVLIDNPDDKIVNANNIKKHLVISAASHAKSNDQFLHLRSQLTSIILTKLDEVPTVGTQILLSAKLSAPISFLNDSSDISSKLITASKNNISEYITLNTNEEEAMINNISTEYSYAQ